MRTQEIMSLLKTVLVFLENNAIFIFEIIGTVAFAISGACVAVSKKMDIFGVVILGTTTAVGGGIIRDLILGIVPPSAFQKPVYALVAIVVSIVVFMPKIRGIAEKQNGPLLLTMDSIGLAVFTVVGVRAGMPEGNIFLAVFVGALTGVGGGIMRDLFAGNSPYIFSKHFYASASLIGAVIAALCWRYGAAVSMLAGGIPIVILRLLAAKYRWRLPKA